MTLSYHGNTKLRVILQFINDDIDVARPVLTYSEALNDLDLLYIIQFHYAPTRDEIGRMMAAEAQSGDRIVIMGARDDTLTDFAKSILE